MVRNMILFLFLASITCLHTQEIKQDQTQTKVTFKIKNFGVNVDGDFSDVNITSNLNKANLSESYLNASIVVKSISTGNRKRDKHILEEDYFDEPNHKAITLQSTKIEKNNDGSLQLYADLTIKGITKKIEIPLTVNEAENRIKITAKFELNRKDFKVGGSSFILSKKVKIQVEYSGTR